MLSARSTKIMLETWNPAFWLVEFGVWVHKTDSKVLWLQGLLSLISPFNCQKLYRKPASCWSFYQNLTSIYILLLCIIGKKNLGESKICFLCMFSEILTVFNFYFDEIWLCCYVLFIGPHNATYTVKETSTGLQFTKVRHEPLVKNAGGKYQKVRPIFEHLSLTKTRYI